MVARQLVNSDIEKGRQLLEALRASGFPMDAAFWYRSSDEEEFRLNVATELMDRNDPRAAYTKMVEALQNFKRSQYPDIYLISTKTPLVKAFHASGEMTDVRMDSTFVEGTYFHDGYVYFAGREPGDSWLRKAS